jgi:hypothetical protein
VAVSTVSAWPAWRLGKVIAEIVHINLDHFKLAILLLMALSRHSFTPSAVPWLSETPSSIFSGRWLPRVVPLHLTVIPPLEVLFWNKILVFQLFFFNLILNFKPRLFLFPQLGFYFSVLEIVIKNIIKLNLSFLPRFSRVRQVRAPWRDRALLLIDHIVCR